MNNQKNINQKGTFLVSPAYHKSSKFLISFDDKKSVSHAGLVLIDELANKLDLIKAADNLIDLGNVAGRANPGQKIMTLIESLVVGGDCIDDADILRSGSTSNIVSHKVMAPSTLGTFLRSFTFGHLKQLDKLTAELLKTAWNFNISSKNDNLTIDLDSTICEVHGKQKQGASYGYTKVLGLHPLIASLSNTGEIVHVRNRRGSAHSGKGSDHFIKETIKRVRDTGAVGDITLRADSGFYSQYVIKACRAKEINYSITAKLTGPVRKAIESIDDSNFVEIDYTLNGKAYVGETPYGDNQRLIVRRTKITGVQSELFPNYRYHAFVTNLDKDKVELDAYHRDHAVIELNIKDLKENVGLNHMPSGKFNANGAWLIIASIAYNMMIWINLLTNQTKITAKTFRKRFINIAGRITRKARTLIVHLPYKWPFQKQWFDILDEIQLLTIKT